MNLEIFITLLINIGITILILLLLRPLVLWYNKTNERLKVLKSINNKLIHIMPKEYELDDLDIIMKKKREDEKCKEQYQNNQKNI